MVPDYLTPEEIDKLLPSQMRGRHCLSGAEAAALRTHVVVSADRIRNLERQLAASRSAHMLTNPFAFDDIAEMCQDVVDGEFAEWGIDDGVDQFHGRPLRVQLNECCERMAEALAIQVHKNAKMIADEASREAVQALADIERLPVGSWIDKCSDGYVVQLVRPAIGKWPYREGTLPNVLRAAVAAMENQP